MKQYIIDGQPASANDIIDLAKTLGFEPEIEGVYFASAASAYLRRHGHEISENKDADRSE